MASNGTGRCCICSKAVYATELMVVDEREYHKGCFRCSVCNRPITITSYTSYNGDLFCKVHKPSLDSKNPDQLRLHHDGSPSLKHSRNQTAPPLVFNKQPSKLHENDTISPITESVNSLKNIFEKNDFTVSAPATPQSPSFSSSPSTCERIESLKKEIQQNNGTNNDILYRSSVRIKKKNSIVAADNTNSGEKKERFSKMLDEIDETWNEFEKSNSEYIKSNQLSRNTSSSSLKDRCNETMKRRSAIVGIIREGIPIHYEANEKDDIKEESMSDDNEEQTNEEDYKRCLKEMDDILRNIDSYISNYYERKNETSSTESSIESFLEEYSIDSSIKQTTTKESNTNNIINSSNIIGGINNIFKKNSEKGNNNNSNNNNNNTSNNNNQNKSNILWIRSSSGYKYEKIGSKRQNESHKKYLTSSTLQDYLNVAFETKLEDSRSLEDICNSIEQYNSELKHGCEQSLTSTNNRPLIEVVASPLKFLVETLNSFYMKIRGIIHTSKLKKFINLLMSIEDILIKEGLQHSIEIQTQIECSELLINACETMNNYSQNVLIKYNKLRQKMNVFVRDTFREEIIANDDDVSYSYADCVLDRVNTDAKIYRNSFIDQEHRNYVGNQQCVGGPFIISVKKLKKNQSSDVKTEDAAYQAIVRIKDVPEIIVLIPSVTVRFQAKLRSSTSWKTVLQSIHPEININNVCKIKEKDKGFQKKLMDLDEFQCVQKFKFGVLYAKEGQTSEEEMFNNENGSPAFDEFLSILGDTVELKNYTGYTAGLDVQYGNTGNTTVVTKWRDYEVTYHVSTMLPYDKDDIQQIQRKRHIGNDIVCFIFLDGKAKFDPATIVSQFLHVFIVVQPLQPEESLGIGYRVTVVSKTDVPIFGPPLPPSGIFHNISSLRDFLLAKSINGENAAYLAPKFYKPQLRTRGALIEDLVKDYYEITTSINSSLSLNNMSNLGTSSLTQSPTNGTIRSLDENFNREKKNSSVTPTVTVVEEENDDEFLSNNKTRSTNNLNENMETSESRLNRYDSCDSLSIKNQNSKNNLYRSQNSISSENGDKKKSISTLFSSISNLGKNKTHGAVQPNPAK